MKVKTYVYIIISILILLIIFFFIFNNNDILHEKQLNRYLFNNSKDISFKKECYVDLIGISTDGSIYDFYKYKVEGIKDESIKSEFPQFNLMYDIKHLENINYSYWKNTPLNEKDKNELFFITHTSNLNKHKCSSEFIKLDLLNKKGNYYSFFGAYPIGIYLYIYSPNEKYLYIIIKK